MPARTPYVKMVAAKIDQNMLDRLRAYAEDNQMRHSDVIRDALDSLLAKTQLPSPQPARRRLV